MTTTPLHQTTTLEQPREDLDGAVGAADPSTFVARQVSRLAHAVGHVVARSLGGLAQDAGLPTFL